MQSTSIAWSTNPTKMITHHIRSGKVWQNCSIKSVGRKVWQIGARTRDNQYIVWHCFLRGSSWVWPWGKIVSKVSPAVDLVIQGHHTYKAIHWQWWLTALTLNFSILIVIRWWMIAIDGLAWPHFFWAGVIISTQTKKADLYRQVVQNTCMQHLDLHLT